MPMRRRLEKATNRADCVSVAPNNLPSVLLTNPHAIDMPPAVFLMQDAGFLGMIDQLADHKFQKFLQSETRFHNCSIEVRETGLHPVMEARPVNLS